MHRVARGRATIASACALPYPASATSTCDHEVLLSAILHSLIVLLLVILPGGACVLWAMPRGTRRSAQCGTALAISVPLGGAILAGLMLLGLALNAAAWMLLGLSAVAFAAGLLRRRRGAAAGLPVRDERSIWWIAIACVVATALFPALSEWWRISSDSWTHAAIVRSIEIGGVPPTDPILAGLRLQYAWIYHAFVAGAHAVTGLDVYGLMAVLDAVALASVILCAGSLVADLGRARMVWTLLLLLLGMNALFPLFLPLQIAKAFTGEVRGMAELGRQFDIFPLEWDRTGGFLRSLGGQDFFLNKFMVATPFALSLAALTAWAACFRRWMKQGGRGELALAVLLTAGAGLMHPVVEVFLVTTTAAVLALALVLRRRDRALQLLLLKWFLAVVAGFVPTALYILTILGGTGGAHREFPLDLAPLKLLGYACCLGLGVVFAVRPLLRQLRGTADEFAWALWTLAGCALALVFRLPGPTPFFTVDKFSYLVWIPLVITAGPAFADFLRARSPAVRALLVVLLFVPVNGLALTSRVVDPHFRVRQPWDAEGYAWIRAHTAPDAILLTPPDDWDAGGLAERDQYFTLEHVAVQLGYDFGEIQARRELLKRLFESGRLSAEDRRRLEALHRPIYALWTDFRDPRWRYSPGAWARSDSLASRPPEFDPAFPVAFRSPEQEIRVIAPPARP